MYGNAIANGCCVCCRFCDLSEESCKKAPFKDCRMVSFIDYLAALQIPGNVSLSLSSLSLSSSTTDMYLQMEQFLICWV